MMMPIRSTGLGRLGDQSITDIIAQAAQAQGVPVQLAMAQATQESSLNPGATHLENNGCTAYGLFQLEDCYFASQGDLTDPTVNANVALAYLKSLYQKYGNWTDALDAYNEGPTKFDQGSRAGAGYAAGIMASCGAACAGGTTTPPVAAVPAPAAPAPPGATPPPQTGLSVATVALVAVAGLFAVEMLS